MPKNNYYIRNKISYLLISFNLGISSISQLSVNYLFKDVYLANPSDLTKIHLCAGIPWMMKPFFGSITDCVPLCGYRRKVYIIFCAITSSLSWVVMNNYSTTFYGASFCIIVNNVCLSFSTVLSHAILVELSKEEESDTNNLSGLYSFYKYIGFFIASCLKGYLLQKFSIRFVFTLASILPVFLLFSGFILYEKGVKKKSTKVLKKSSFKKEKNLLEKFCKFFFQKKVLIPTIFIVFLMFFTPNFDSVFFYYCSEKLGITPNSFGINSIVNTIACIAISQFYSHSLVNFGFKKIIFISRLGILLGYAIEYCLIKRYNVEYGYPDYLFMFFATSIMMGIRELTLLPIFTLACSLSPKDLEGTIFSMLMSASSLGEIAGTYMGAQLTDSFGITKTNYDNLGIVIKLLIVLLFVPLPVLFLIPGNYFKKENNIKKKKNPKNPMDENLSESDLDSEDYEEELNEEVI